MKVTEAFITT
jgi:pyruvate kinase